MAVDNRRGSVRSHHRQFTAGPAHDHICPQSPAAHADVGAAVGLADDYGQLGHGGFGIGKEHFGAVADDAAPFLVRPGQISGYIHQGDQRDIEGIAEADKAGSFIAGIDIQTAGFGPGLVGDDADAVAVQAGRSR